MVLLAFTCLTATGQTPAQPAALTTMTLVDPSVLKLADGVERKDARQGTTEAYLPVLYPSSHAANLLELKNGDVLCVWFSGTWEGSSDVAIVISRRPKGSRNWGPTVMIDHHVGESYQNPVLFQEPDGTVDLYHTTQGAEAGEANAHVLHLVSKDNGKSWTKPELIFAKPGAFTRHPLLTLKDGTWMLPMTYVTSAGIGAGAETNYSAVELSKDNGKSWKECLMADTFGKVQPTVVALAPDRFLSFFRSRASDFVYSSSSTDGCTWTPAVPTVLPNNNASVQVFRLRNGHLVMAFNNSSKNAPGGALRKPLSIALSVDEGKTWRSVRDVETGRPGYGMAEQRIKKPGREEYSYPTIMETKSGEILVAFTYRRQTIKVVSFREDWIKQGGTAGEFKGTR
ncbi:MAG: exo-alpha-sialidase [Terracidiphilus sp.]|nr:exo-alpha-sialidase [Terracidiphilus sp.]MDR3777438.1 exo-alpha-sialidase [Terracidiphilus sp.]